jgi:hypothetical protein
MKIAYCMSGHTRGLEKTPTEPNKFFIENETVDIFISTWESTGAGKIFWQGVVEDNNLIDEDSVISVYSPVKLEVSSSKEYEYLNKFNYQFPNSIHKVNILNTLLMFKKIKRSFELVDESYDILIRSRFDVTGLGMNLVEVEDGVIYGKLSPTNHMPSDVFFFGNRETMIDCIPDESFYTEEIINKCMNAEDVFKRHMESKGIEFRVVPDLFYVLKNEVRY